MDNGTPTLKINSTLIMKNLKPELTPHPVCRIVYYHYGTLDGVLFLPLDLALSVSALRIDRNKYD